MVKVYIKTNEKDEITEVGSSIFIEDTKGWTEIDEGSGDRYVHAQNNYLPGPVVDEQGNPRNKNINGQIFRVNADN